MIIFDLDGTLACPEHRRHFVDPTRHINPDYGNSDWIRSESPEGQFLSYVNVRNPVKFKPDWTAFYEACDKDSPIIKTRELFHHLHRCEEEVSIWSGRCESVKEKTIQWLVDHFSLMYCSGFDYDRHLKMRPIGDSTPEDELKERWFDELILSDAKKGRNFGNLNIDFVFDSDRKSISMWRKRCIFVFDCNQDGRED